MTLHVVDHPLVKHHLASLRLASTSARDFRRLVHAITGFVVTEATRSLPTAGVEGDGPLAHFEAEAIEERVGLVPILRAGLGMVDSAMDMLPDHTTVLHIGLFREKVSLQPVEYYSKLPSEPTVDRVLILDPLIATGGTAATCVGMIKDWGIPIEKITVLAVLGSKPGLDAVQRAWPGLDIWTGAIDEKLTKEGYILPGLGDTGDRLFNTT